MSSASDTLVAGREPARHLRTDGLLPFNIAVRDGVNGKVSVHDEAT